MKTTRDVPISLKTACLWATIMRETVYFGFKDRSTSCPLLSAETLLGSSTTKQMPREWVCHDGNRSQHTGTLPPSTSTDSQPWCTTGITRCSRQKPLAPPYGAVDFLKELSVLYQKSGRVAVYSTPAGIRAFKIGTHYPFVFTIVKTNNPWCTLIILNTARNFPFFFYFRTVYW